MGVPPAAQLDRLAPEEKRWGLPRLQVRTSWFPVTIYTPLGGFAT